MKVEVCRGRLESGDDKPEVGLERTKKSTMTDLRSQGVTHKGHKPLSFTTVIAIASPETLEESS